LYYSRIEIRLDTLHSTASIPLDIGMLAFCRGESDVKSLMGEIEVVYLAVSETDMRCGKKTKEDLQGSAV